MSRIQNAYIFDALRTPRGKGRPASDAKPGGALAAVPPYELVSGLIAELAQRNPSLIAQTRSLTLGCVGQVGPQGGHIALVSRLASVLPDDVPVLSLNNYCVSGASAVNRAAQAVAVNTGGLHLAGGVESLSQVPFLADKASYYTDPDLLQTLRWAPPIMGAELIATLDGFGKHDLDELTLLSHQRAAAAWREGRYAEGVAPVKDGQGNSLLSQDELIREQLTLSQLADMPPAFADQGAQGFDAMMLEQHPNLNGIKHVHSIANCPGMADAAALVLLGSMQAGKDAGLTAKAHIVAVEEIGGDPVLQLTAGMQALDRLLARTKLTLMDFDRIEFMEAFAAVPLKFIRDYTPDMDKLNVNGGHLAMGHPTGATGALLLTSLVHELQRCDGQYGLLVTQAGGGIGCAIIVERTN
ncbi:MAG: acetyl-CoA C-acyltransferase [Gammaproteobacteria bacterium]|nr:acetyl-CoA C-acyltransferase [Gammaproteobacteria bacterium]